MSMPAIESISALTLFVSDMKRSVEFYESLEFERLYGGAESEFTSYRVGDGFLNLALREGLKPMGAWGRSIFYVENVDATYQTLCRAGHAPEFSPRDAAWGERYFHLRDPDGHELSFARPLNNVDT
jgi:catechol 2,3-dioxygenase-like lactoylglutathione lyase family enzyme